MLGDTLLHLAAEAFGYYLNEVGAEADLECRWLLDEGHNHCNCVGEATQEALTTVKEFEFTVHTILVPVSPGRCRLYGLPV